MITIKLAYSDYSWLQLTVDSLQ